MERNRKKKVKKKKKKNETKGMSRRLPLRIFRSDFFCVLIYLQNRKLLIFAEAEQSF